MLECISESSPLRQRLLELPRGSKRQCPTKLRRNKISWFLRLVSFVQNSNANGKTHLLLIKLDFCQQKRLRVFCTQKGHMLKNTKFILKVLFLFCLHINWNFVLQMLPHSKSFPCLFSSLFLRFLFQTTRHHLGVAAAAVEGTAAVGRRLKAPRRVQQLL